MLSLRRCRLPHWIALLAMWFAALAPTVSHALARAQSVAWVDVCSVASRAGAGEPGAAAGDPERADWLDDLRACGYCVPVAGAAPLPSASGPMGVASIEPGLVLASAPADAPRFQVAWAWLPSRAPPVRV